MARARSAETSGDSVQGLEGVDCGSSERPLTLARPIIAGCGTIERLSTHMLSMLSLMPNVRSSERRARACSSRAFALIGPFVPASAALDENWRRSTETLMRRVDAENNRQPDYLRFLCVHSLPASDELCQGTVESKPFWSGGLSIDLRQSVNRSYRFHLT